MRLDAANGDTGYKVWHCELMRDLGNVTRWVDDSIPAWGELDRSEVAMSIARVSGVLSTVTRPAKRILIDLVAKLVLINPVPDEPAEEAAESSSTGNHL